MNPGDLSTAIPKRYILIALFLLLGLGGWAFFDTFSNVGYAPEQPIPYSHLMHAGTSKIPCLYCHSSAERSRHATIPSAASCMNCHSVVGADKPTIQALAKYYDSGKPVPWVRVHRLPDYVYFSHRWHVAKGITCQQCHGQVQEMTVMKQSENLKMGWCIDCHRKEKASQECNTCHM